MTELDALQAVLATEHAAVYGYGVVAAQTAGEQRRTALNALDVHRVRRDRLRALIVAADAAPVEAAAAYRIAGGAVRTPQAAARLAADTERDVALALGALVEHGARTEREFAANALQEAAVRETYWRGRAPALPGLPVAAIADPSASPTP
ncbi:MAG: ferritin-like domain-containing protein [Sporichthyaceae bacterium]